MLFVVGSEILARHVIIPRDGFAAYRKTFMATDAPTVAFGDSRVANAIAPNVRIANLGYGAETLPVMVGKAQAFARRGGRTRRIVLQFAPHHWSNYRLAVDQGDMLEELLEGGEPWLASMQPRIRRYLLKYWESAVRNPRLLLAPPARAPEAVAAQRGGFAALSPRDQERAATLRVQSQTPLPEGPAADALIAQLVAAVAELRARKLEVCLVEYPLTRAYRRVTDILPVFAAVRGRVRAALMAGGVTPVDLTDALDDTQFADSDHVAPWGRARATALVLERCFGKAVAEDAP